MNRLQLAYRLAGYRITEPEQAAAVLRMANGRCVCPSAR